MRAYEFDSNVVNNAIPIPEEYRGKFRSKIRVIVLSPEEENRADRQLKALETFRQEIRACDEPLGSEFDEIISRRINISREIDL